MKHYLVIAAFLALVATASPDFVTTTKDNASPVVAAIPTCTFDPKTGEYKCPKNKASPIVPAIPTCTFDPKAGEYKCPKATKTATASGEIKANADIDTIAEDNAVVAAADCGKCQRDWSDCMALTTSRSGAAGSTIATTPASASLSRTTLAARTALPDSAMLKPSQDGDSSWPHSN
ncbi:hypothetical protein OPT61_g9708 [Boeremia exigua]|uniref:Uncharacterized protein n=1 Tax=Boeremia exigua TaxID=749465 RepID=A0ACC2HTW8_9PLEO|nr:hypothetical protein OPT61_g9708 [Boeremia exigua]